MSNLKVSIQLFSVRDKMQEDFEGTLRKIKEIGYDYVEFAGYFDHTAKEVKEIMDRYGLKSPSIHQGYRTCTDMGEANAEYLSTLGVECAIIPYCPPDMLYGTDKWNETLSYFEDSKRVLSPAGIKLGYHNHDHEFKKVIDGKNLLEWLLASVNGLECELDTCWAHTAGIDPCDFLRTQRENEKFVHIKDFVCPSLGIGHFYKKDGTYQWQLQTRTGVSLCPIGEGIQEWDRIVATSEAIGAEYLVVEQDQWYDWDSLDCAARSRRFLKERFGI